MLHKTQAGFLAVIALALAAGAARAEGLVITTLAGTAGSSGSTDGVGSAALFNSPSSVAVDAGGNIYVADTGNHTIRKITPGGTVTTLAGLVGNSGSTDGPASTAQFNSPAGLAVDSGGNVYVADTMNNTIRVITATGTVSTLAGTAGSPGGTDGTGSAARFSGPLGIAVAGGIVYVADTGNNTIRQVSSAGVVNTLAGTAGKAGSTDGAAGAALFQYPSGVAVDSSGNVYVADQHNNTVRKITASVVSTFAGLAGSGNASGANGTGNQARFNNPAGVAMDGHGNVYVADLSNDTIRKITSAGVVTTLAGIATYSGNADGSGVAARFSGPSAVAVGADGSVYVADTGNDTIRKGEPGPFDALHVELNWDVATDLDLYVKEPSGNIVDYQNTTSTTGGTYLTDVTNGTGPEVDWWTTLPTGTFEYWATNYSGSMAANFTLSVYQDGVLTATHSGTLAAVAGQESTHFTFQVGSSNGSGALLAITSLTASGTSVLVGDTVTFSAACSNPNTANAFTFGWDFGDLNTASTPVSAPAGSTSHVYSTAGTYTAAVFASDGTGTSAPATVGITVVAPAPSGAGVTNVATGSTVNNPLQNMAIGVTESNGGVVVLDIQVSGLLSESVLRSLYTVSTSFGGILQGRAGVLGTAKGYAPAQKFSDPSVYVATATASGVDSTTNNPAVKMARRTIAISNAEVGLPHPFTGAPPKQAISRMTIKGKFALPKAGATPATKDNVTLSAQVEMPVGLKLSDGLDFTLGIGNIIDHVTVNGKGQLPKGSSSDLKNIQKISVKFPAVDKHTGLTVAPKKGVPTATINVTLSQADMVANGFGTEGVGYNASSVSSKGKVAPTDLKIQVAFVIAGVSYEDLAPATLKVALSSKGNTATLLPGRAAHP
ncbi:MAG: PKD domain-containing protein [Planctomycetota bacterium]